MPNTVKVGDTVVLGNFTKEAIEEYSRLEKLFGKVGVITKIGTSRHPVDINFNSDVMADISVNYSEIVKVITKEENPEYFL